MAHDNKKGQIMLMDSWCEVFQMMSNEQAGQMVKAMYDYHLNGNDPKNLPTESALFWVVVKNWLDDNSQHYQEVCEKRAQAAQHRWKKKSDKEKDSPATTQEEKFAYKLLEKLNLHDGEFAGDDVVYNMSKSNIDYICDAIKLFKTDDGKLDTKRIDNAIDHIATKQSFDDCIVDGNKVSFDLVADKIVGALERF